jgi:hypothetical protein
MITQAVYNRVAYAVATEASCPGVHFSALRSVYLDAGVPADTSVRVPVQFAVELSVRDLIEDEMRELSVRDLIEDAMRELAYAVQ